MVLVVVVGLVWSAAAQDAAATGANTGAANKEVRVGSPLVAEKAQADLVPASWPAPPGLGSPQPLLGPAAPMPITPMIAPRRAPLPAEKVTHRFFDKENLAIFAALAGARTLDMFSTWQFRRNGLHEGELSDGFVDNKPLFAAYSGSLVAGQIATCYVFHRMRWHKLERITALVHTGAVTEAVIHNYRLKPAH